MEKQILGLHHITAIAGEPQRNYDFYTGTLGLRMVKRTVNFDDPQTYHFYFGDAEGNPGTILTFFPWPRVKEGRNGAGMATEIGYSVPQGSLAFWKDRFEKLQVSHDPVRERFGEKYVTFRDPDGLVLSLVETGKEDPRKGWETADIKSEHALKGFHSVTLTVNRPEPTAAVLTGVFGYEEEAKEGNLHRYRINVVETAAIVDLQIDASAPFGHVAGGTNHHVAFRVKDEEVQAAIREKVVEKGLQITQKIDRDYFFSVYFREPGGVLFEVATDNPGFAIDESPEELGTSLRLPERYEPMREKLEKSLPVLNSENPKPLP